MHKRNRTLRLLYRMTNESIRRANRQIARAIEAQGQIQIHDKYIINGTSITYDTQEIGILWYVHL